MSNHWTPRAAAARAVAEVLFHHRSLTTALPKATESLDPGDHALTQEITYGVLRHSFQLEAIAKKLLKRPFKKKNGDLHGLVLGGLYQLQWMRVPPHAALSETVNATAVLKKEWARGVINAVLRRFQREQEALLEATNQQPSLRFNHPQWIIQKLQQGWPEHWERTLHANNQRPPMSLRVNLQQQSRDHYLEALCSSGIEIAPPTEPPVNIPTLITLKKGVAVTLLPNFENGAVSVQDGAPQLAAPLLDPQANERILDACAAPGGKSGHLLEYQPAIGELVALERDRVRLSLLQENMKRLGVRVTPLQGDAATTEWWDGTPFDRILLDAPCSASGVIRRNPDIKQLRRSEDIPSLVQQQSAILENCWGLLRQGGRLLYATCSIFPEENEQQIHTFLQQHPEAVVEPIQLDCGHATGAGHQLLPGECGMDGFYYACLRKPGAP